MFVYVVLHLGLADSVSVVVSVAIMTAKTTVDIWLLEYVLTFSCLNYLEKNMQRCRGMFQLFVKIDLDKELEVFLSDRILLFEFLQFFDIHVHVLQCNSSYRLINQNIAKALIFYIALFPI